MSVRPAQGRIERRRQRFANENALSRHLHALPVGLDECLAAQVDLREDGRSRVDYHSFRRWFITEAVRHSGHPEWVVSEIVGHAIGKQSVTIGTYFGGSLDEKLVAVVESVTLPSAG